MTVKIPEPPIPSVWVLDANVLFSDWARALLLCLSSLAGARLCWSPLVEDEAFRNLVRLGRLTPEDAQSQRQAMAVWMQAQLLPQANPAYFDDLKSVDEKDRHVAALALELHHQQQAYIGLVTWNSKDFPRKPLMKKGIVRYSPDDLAFLMLSNPRSEPSPLQFLESTLQEVLNFKSQHPLSAPTEFAQRARPWPQTGDEWQDFLTRNRMHRLSRFLARWSSPVST